MLLLVEGVHLGIAAQPIRGRDQASLEAPAGPPAKLGLDALAARLIAAGLASEALAQARMAVQLSPDSPEFLKNLAVLLADCTGPAGGAPARRL